MQFFRIHQYVVCRFRCFVDPGLFEQVGAIGENLRMWLDRNGKDFAVVNNTIPGRCLKIRVVHRPGHGGEVQEKAFVFAKLRQVDGDYVIPGLAVLRIKQYLLMQRVERQDVQLDLASGHFLHVIMHLLHGLEDRVADDDETYRLSIEDILGLSAAGEQCARHKCCDRSPLL